MVYDNDEKTHEMSNSERLKYHQEHSEPIMDKLYDYLKHQLDSKQVEPNDSLGKAVKYMLKHWHECVFSVDLRKRHKPAHLY